MLYLKNVEMLVTEYNEDCQDWSGNCWSKGVLDDKIEMRHTGIEDIKNAMRKIIDISFENQEVQIFIDEGVIQYSQTENSEAECDDNGKYLVDYIFRIIEETEYTDIPDGNF